MNRSSRSFSPNPYRGRLPCAGRLSVACTAALLCCGVTPLPAVAGDLPDSFTLGRYVPEDVWFLVHHVENPERKWIQGRWAEIFTAVADSGIDRDVTSLVLSLVGEENRTDVEGSIDRATKLIRQVRWGDLIKREFLFAERISHSQLGGAYLLLARGAPGSGEKNFAGVTAILREIAAMSGCARISESSEHGVQLWSLQFAGHGLSKVGFSLELFRKDDLIGLATGSRTRDDAVRLISGKGGTKSILSSKRFKKALDSVEPPRDTLTYADMKLFVRDLEQMFEAFDKPENAHTMHRRQLRDAARLASSVKPEERPEPEVSPEHILRKLVQHIDVLDYGIRTVGTKGLRRHTHSVLHLQPGKHELPLAATLLKRKPFERFDRFIPADATGFSLSPMLDVEGLYNFARGFVKESIPGGVEIVAKFDAQLTSVEFDLKRDLFSWWSGEYIHVEMPAAVVTPFGGSDGVVMFRVKDHAIASQKVNAALDFVAAKLKGSGQMVMLTPAPVEAEGFRQIMHPAMAMFIQPVVGVHGDWLMIGTSPNAINRCLQVEAGTAESITSNERFAREGLLPPHPVRSLSFKDTSNFGKSSAAAVGMLGMVGGMFVAGLPAEDEEARRFKKVAQSALAIAMKLGPILQKIDFYSSESCMTTYDGKSTIRTESVVTYKATSAHPPQPVAPVVPTAPIPPHKH